jgi:hypothetical protein
MRKAAVIVVAISLVAFLTVSLFVANYSPHPRVFKEDIHVGVTANSNVADTRHLIDAVKGYTNLVVFMSPEIYKNVSALEDVCSYAQASGLDFFVYTTHPTFGGFNFNPIAWSTTAKAKYGSHFLGYYLYDEPGGNQLDRGTFRQFDNTTMPPDYKNAANTYSYYMFLMMRDFIKNATLVTSDYGLFWYDYEAGYDTVFCEFGRNTVRDLEIAQCRGAAEMHNKTWGVTITWTYDEPPYIVPPTVLYDDMVEAYAAGAKYILVFNYPQLGEYGLLTEQHMQEMQRFRDYANSRPQNQTSNTQRLAYALPDNYGWGMRRADDTIWGVWPADGNSTKIWSDLNSLSAKYGSTFDIITYSPWSRLFWKQHYDTLVRWNTNSVP